jgi:hypothetical protein
MSPNAEGGGGVAESQPMNTWSQNKLWRSNSIFNLCFGCFDQQGEGGLEQSPATTIMLDLFFTDFLLKAFQCHERHGKILEGRGDKKGPARVKPVFERKVPTGENRQYTVKPQDMYLPVICYTR